MSDIPVPLIDDIEAEFREDLASDRFDQYLFVTYRVDLPYIRQFDHDDSVLICGPEEVGECIETVDRTNVEWRQNDAHAKCYLMWNTEAVKVWFGSFNLTESGLRSSIEWGVAHEVQIDRELVLSTLQKGACNPESITSDALIQQALDVLQATLTESSPTLSADFRSLSGSSGVTLLTNAALPGPNGFHELLRQILAGAKSAKLTYFTPFVTRSGVRDLAGAVPDDLDADSIDIEIRTCRIEAVDDPESYLDRDDLEALSAQYGSVELLARTAGQPGEELSDGIQLRPGLAHFKMLLCTYESDDGVDKSELVLTSANLSSHAWNAHTSQLEYGLWVRDQTLTEQLTTFFRDRLSCCYSRPNEFDFDVIAGLERTESLLSKHSLLDRIESQCSVTAGGLRLDWPETEPLLEDVQATLLLRELATGDTDSSDIDLVWQADEAAYQGQFDEGLLDPGWVIDRIEMTVTTTVFPIEYELTTAGREQLVSPDSVRVTIDALATALKRRDIDCDQLILNNDIVVDSGSSAVPALEDIDSIRIRRSFNADARKFVTSVESSTQPHIDDAALADVTATAEEIQPAGGFGRVDVTAANNVVLEHDMLTFLDERGSVVDYLGYADRTEGYAYYFDDEFAGATLTVCVGEPYDAYVPETRTRVTLPAPIPDTDNRIQRLPETASYQFTHRPAVSESAVDDQADVYLTSETPVEVTPPPELVNAVDTTDRLTYEWQRRVGGYRAPIQDTLEHEISPNPAHSHIEYRGLLTISDGGADVTLRTPVNQYRVKQQVFDADASPDSKVARGRRDLNEVELDDHIDWLVFTTDSLCKRSVRLGSGRSVNLGVTIDETDYYCSRSYPAYADGQLFLIPLFGRHIDGTSVVRLRLRVDGGPASYGASELVREIHHQRVGQGVRRTIFDANGDRRSQIDIPHDPDQEYPRLDMYQDQIYSKQLKEYLDRNESFRVHERTPSELVIEAVDTTVLCLGPYSAG